MQRYVVVIILRTARHLYEKYIREASYRKQHRTSVLYVTKVIDQGRGVLPILTGQEPAWS